MTDIKHFFSRHAHVPSCIDDKVLEPVRQSQLLAPMPAVQQQNVHLRVSCWHGAERVHLLQ